MTSTPHPITTRRAATAAAQVTALYANHPADEVAAFLTTMCGYPKPETFARPRHVKQHRTT